MFACTTCGASWHKLFPTNISDDSSNVMDFLPPRPLLLLHIVTVVFTRYLFD